jgi:hypothetical protein
MMKRSLIVTAMLLAISVSTQPATAEWKCGSDPRYLEIMEALAKRTESSAKMMGSLRKMVALNCAGPFCGKIDAGILESQREEEKLAAAVRTLVGLPAKGR